jgi:hypothetical protein
MSRSMIAILAGVAFGWSGVAAVAADPPASPPATRAAETLKERLSDKASDEQRVNDCHVPPERRGAKQRPVDCVPDAAAKGSNPSGVAPARGASAR